MEKQIMYCLFDPEGKADIEYIAKKEFGVRFLVVFVHLKRWKKLKAEGYTIRKVEVTIKEI